MSSRTTHPLRRGFDLNCDLGEGEPPDRTAALFARVDSANIACGGHAGDDASMDRCLALAKLEGVRAGAHPGLPTRKDFGRNPKSAEGLTDAVLIRLLEEQVRRLAVRAREAGVKLHHLKLHGALYHAVEREARLAETYLDWAAVRCRGFRVYARAGGAVEAESTRRGGEVEVWSEGFLDRGYAPDGTLVPRGEPGAILDGIPQVLERLADFRQRGGCKAVDGTWVAMNPRTLCVHGDGPHALEWLEAVRVVMPRSPQPP